MRLTYIILLAGVFVSCKPKKIEKETTAGSIDATTFVAVGGDRVAGYQHDALSYEGQQNSLGAILHAQLQLIGSGDYNQPLISDQSLGINANGDAQLMMGYKTDCNGEESLSPVRYAVTGNTAALSDNLFGANGPFNNMGVPSLSITDISVAGYTNMYYDRFSSGGSNSITDDALANDPTFFLVDLGQDDILNYALSGGTQNPILPASGAGGFAGHYSQLLTVLASQNTEGVVCNIPDITTFPYFTTIPYNGLTLDSANASTMNQVFNPLGISFVEGDNPFTMEDQNEPFGVRKMQPGELILLSVPLDSVKCYGMGSIVPIPDEYVLSLEEINEIQTKTTAFNNIINNQANNFNLALADFNSLINSVHLGLTHNGVNYSSVFVSGGFFSLDGRNPTSKGMALLANKCIAAINKKYGATIPFAEVSQYDGIRFP